MKFSRKHALCLCVCLCVLCLAAAGVLHIGKKKKVKSTSDIGELLEAQFQEDDGNLHVWFLDVGQGSAALIRTNGKYMLVDTGGKASAERVLSFLKENHVMELGYIVLTGYEEDHLAGAPEIMVNIEVDHVLAPESVSGTSLYEEYEQSALENKVEIIHPTRGETYSFGNAFFTIVGPVSYGKMGEADNSLSLRLDYGDTSFLFCGDITAEGEEALINEFVNAGDVSLQADVYIVNNHGSADSGTQNFLRCVRPQYAVLSCGAENAEGFPARSSMERLEEEEIKLYRTDVQGTIEAVSDGSAVTWMEKPCNDYSYRSDK